MTVNKQHDYYKHKPFFFHGVNSFNIRYYLPCMFSKKKKKKKKTEKTSDSFLHTHKNLRLPLSVSDCHTGYQPDTFPGLN